MSANKKCLDFKKMQFLTAYLPFHTIQLFIKGNSEICYFRDLFSYIPVGAVGGVSCWWLLINMIFDLAILIRTPNAPPDFLNVFKIPGRFTML